MMSYPRAIKARGDIEDIASILRKEIQTFVDSVLRPYDNGLSDRDLVILENFVETYFMTTVRFPCDLVAYDTYPSGHGLSKYPWMYSSLKALAGVLKIRETGMPATNIEIHFNIVPYMKGTGVVRYSVIKTDIWYDNFQDFGVDKPEKTF